MSEALAVLLIIVAALLIRAVVSLILRRLSIVPTDPKARSAGIRDIRDWFERRRSKR